MSGFRSHIDPEIAKYQKAGGNSASVFDVELIAPCSECLFQGWHEAYADPLPTEFTDGKIQLTHVVVALSISHQQEADKLLGESLAGHVCTVPDDWMTKAETYRLY